MNVEDIGKFIANLRKNKKLTQTQVADYVGVSAKSVSKWETGVGVPDIMYLQKLCEILEIEIDELLSAQINRTKRKENRKQKCKYVFLKYFFIIVLPIFISLLCYFIYEYNSFHNYNISVKSSDNFSLIKGSAVSKNNRSFITLSIVQLNNNYIKYDDIISVDIYDKDNLIFHSNENTFNFKINQNLDNKSLIIKIKLESNNIEESLKITFKEDNVKNNANILNKNKKQNKGIYQKLIDYGFKDIGNDTFVLKKNDKIRYDLKNDLFIINYTNKSNTINIYFKPKLNCFEVNVYEKSNYMNILLEKYSYNYSNKKFDCQVGVCSSIDSTLEIIKPYYNLLNGES